MSEGDGQDNADFLAADHPLNADVQREFYELFIKEEKQLQIKLQEVTINRNRVSKQLEEIGVRLYQAQQQLAANQMGYQKAHDNFNIAQRLRIEAQQKLNQVNQLYSGKKEETNILKNKVAKAQKQLENLMRHYHEIEAYNIQLKSDIAVTKIQTFTAEENVTNLEKIKKKQDLLIDSMNEESKRMEEQRNILTAQIISQKEETEEAKKVLREAEAEIEKIVNSKKNLLDKWQKSIIMMQKRDSAIEKVRSQLKEGQEKNVMLLNDLAGFRNQIRKEQEKTEKLGAQANLITKQRNALQLAKKELESKEARVAEQLVILKQSLGKTEEDIKATETERKGIEDSMTLIENNIMKLHTETKRLMEKLIDQKSEHTTIEKTAKNLFRQGQKIGLQIEEKEIELENLSNQIARVKIDQLNSKSQIELLEEKKKEAENEQNEKKYLVITYEVQIRQGHDLNEKKQHQVGRLNKQHDELMSKANDEGKNPLQNKLLNLNRDTDGLEQKCTQLYRQWTIKQTSLVHESNKLQELSEAAKNLENKKTIMQQKKARLNNNYKGFEKQIFEIRISLKGLQQEMNKLNDNIAQNSDKKGKIENEKVNLESEFAEKLKEMQGEAIKLEINIDRIRQEKAELMNQIVECQRQILLWERKYQLEKQMQQALDPNVGQSQIEQLKKQLHRMELKYNSLLKEQEKINVENVRAVRKKVDIQMKYGALNNKKDAAKQKEPQTSKQLENAVKRIKENQAKTLRNLQDIEKKLNNKQLELEKVNQSLEDQNQELRGLESRSHQLEMERVLAKLRKSTDILRISALQKKYKKLEEISNRTAKLMYQEPILRQKLDESKEKNHTLYGTIEQLAQKYEQYAQILQPLLQTHMINHTF